MVQIMFCPLLRSVVGDAVFFSHFIIGKNAIFIVCYFHFFAVFPSNYSELKATLDFMIINRLLQFFHRLNSNIPLVSQSAMLDRDFVDIGQLSPINYCHRPLRGYRIYTISLKEIISQTD